MDLFDAAYEGVAPWDIGRPQRTIIQLDEAGEIAGSVLDVGCGTGENALCLAARGHEVWGIDLTPRAIETARDKAIQRHLTVTFLVHDALKLAALGGASTRSSTHCCFTRSPTKNAPTLHAALHACFDEGAPISCSA